MRTPLRELAMYLHTAGHQVSTQSSAGLHWVVNPARIKAYAQSQLARNKTDRYDAKVIAHFAATQDIRLWTPPAPPSPPVTNELGRDERTGSGEVLCRGGH